MTSGSVFIGESPTQILTVSNVGTVDLNVSAVVTDDFYDPRIHGHDREIPGDLCYVVISSFLSSRWVTLYLNPSHMEAFAEFLPESTVPSKAASR